MGTSAVPIRVEAHVERGLPRFTIVGLREADARESRERIRCGLLGIGVTLPLHRMTVNLAPADLPKAGAAFDLAIVLAVLAAMGELSPQVVARIGAHAELGLDGCLRPVLGTMAAALTAGQHGWEGFFVPAAAAAGASRASVPVLPAQTLEQVVRHLRGGRQLARATRSQTAGARVEQPPELSDVRGQEQAVSAMIVAAAGAHNILLYGPPGCGKSMLARRLPGLLPPLEGDEALEVATIADAAGVAERDPDAQLRPFRAPHHTISQAALVGGGSIRPIIGELSLAHHGVLFLDELPEFRPSAIDCLREPLEEHEVRIRRARWVMRYPARVQLVAAMNLCRCGRTGVSEGQGCSCNDASKRAYQQRVSGAVLDRFDMHVALNLPTASLVSLPQARPSDEVRETVSMARQLQHQRWGPARCNGHVRDAPAAKFRPSAQALSLLRAAAARMQISGRSQQSLLRVARTVADLAGSPDIAPGHMATAISLCRRMEISHD